MNLARDIAELIELRAGDSRAADIVTLVGALLCLRHVDTASGQATTALNALHDLAAGNLTVKAFADRSTQIEHRLRGHQQNAGLLSGEQINFRAITAEKLRTIARWIASQHYEAASASLAEIFDSLIDSYFDTRGTSHQLPHDVVTLTAALLEPQQGNHILDVYCAYGEILQQLATKDPGGNVGVHLHGIVHSETEAIVTRQRLFLRDIPHVTITSDGHNEAGRNLDRIVAYLPGPTRKAEIEQLFMLSRALHQDGRMVLVAPYSTLHSLQPGLQNFKVAANPAIALEGVIALPDSMHANDSTTRLTCIVFARKELQHTVFLDGNLLSSKENQAESLLDAYRLSRDKGKSSSISIAIQLTPAEIKNTLEPRHYIQGAENQQGDVEDLELKLSELLAVYDENRRTYSYLIEQLK